MSLRISAAANGLDWKKASMAAIPERRGINSLSVCFNRQREDPRLATIGIVPHCGR
jgi:hypothetical protein